MKSKRLVKRKLGHVVLIDANVMLYLYTRLITKNPFFKDFNLSSKKVSLLNNIDPFVCRLISAFIFQLMKIRHETSFKTK